MTTTRDFTPAQLEALNVPPDTATDVQFIDNLLADTHVATLKYSQLRRCVFLAPDDGNKYAVEYEAPLDTGDFDVDGGAPDNHGWHGTTVTAVEVEARDVLVTQWVPVKETP